MSNRENITVLEGGGKPNMTKDMVRKLRSELPVMIEYMAVMAELQRAKFDALKSQGFTDEQALELCKQVF